MLCVIIIFSVPACTLVCVFLICYLAIRLSSRKRAIELSVSDR